MEGLRGIAIILVVLFHLQGSFWTHGYLGVDVFLVISGYLLFRSAAAQESADGWRDVGRFAWKRVQRIVPGMCVVILLAVALGLLFLIPEDELFLSKEGIKALQGSVNAFLTKEFSNYFASDSAFNPLLHLWYLAVILQVYLMWAVGKPILQRVPRRWALAALWVVGVASLLRCYSFPLHEWLSEMGAPVWRQKHDISYYATLPRVWEVMTGGVVLLLPGVRRRAWASALTAAGVLGILLPALVGAVPGLGWLGSAPCTLIAVAGTLLVLRYAPEGHLEPLLSNKPLRWVGKISFSVYLVHMPLIVYGKMWEFNQPSTAYLGGIAVASILFGACAWWAVEKRRFPWWAVVTLWGMAYVLCWGGRKTEGYKSVGVPLYVQEKPEYKGYRLCEDADLTANWDPALNFYSWTWGAMCVRGQKPLEIPLLAMGDATQKPSVVLMGDSHLPSCYIGLDSVLAEMGVSGVALTTVVVPIKNYTVDFDNGNYYMNEHKEKVLLKWLKDHPQLTHVMIVNRWKYRFEHTESPERMERELADFLMEIKKLGRKVILIGALPEYDLNIEHYRRVMSLSGGMDSRCYSVCDRAKYAEKHKLVLPVLKRLKDSGVAEVIDPLQALAPQEVFVGMREGEVMTLDECHLSPGGALWLWPRLLPQLRAFIER